MNNSSKTIFFPYKTFINALYDLKAIPFRSANFPTKKENFSSSPSTQHPELVIHSRFTDTPKNCSVQNSIPALPQGAEEKAQAKKKERELPRTRKMVCRQPRGTRKMQGKGGELLYIVTGRIFESGACTRLNPG